MGQLQVGYTQVLNSFEEFQSIPTQGARGWAFVTIDTDYYLAVANQYNNSADRIVQIGVRSR